MTVYKQKHTILDIVSLFCCCPLCLLCPLELFFTCLVCIVIRSNTFIGAPIEMTIVSKERATLSLIWFFVILLRTIGVPANVIEKGQRISSSYTHKIIRFDNSYSLHFIYFTIFNNFFFNFLTNYSKISIYKNINKFKTIRIIITTSICNRSLPQHPKPAVASIVMASHVDVWPRTHSSCKHAVKNTRRSTRRNKWCSPNSQGNAPNGGRYVSNMKCLSIY